MLWPCHRLVGGCDVHGHAAVWRWRLRSTRKVTFSFLSRQEPQEKKEQTEGLAARACFKKTKKPLNQSRRRGAHSHQYARRHSQRSGQPPASDTWALRNSRLSFAVEDLERALKGVHHHLHDSLRCRCHYLWDYFFSLSSKCNTFLLTMTKHLQKRERWSWYKLQLLLHALWLLAYIEQWASVLPPITFQW